MKLFFIRIIFYVVGIICLIFNSYTYYCGVLNNTKGCINGISFQSIVLTIVILDIIEIIFLIIKTILKKIKWINEKIIMTILTVLFLAFFSFNVCFLTIVNLKLPGGTNVCAASICEYAPPTEDTVTCSYLTATGEQTIIKCPNRFINEDVCKASKCNEDLTECIYTQPQGTKVNIDCSEILK